MPSSLELFDALLGVTLIGIGLRVLLACDLFQSIVLFIVFGLLLAIAWCRLEAVDVALAEAAIGAGLTGALLLNTLSATQRYDVTRTARLPEADPVPVAATDSRRSPQTGAHPHRIMRAAETVVFATLLAGGLLVVVVPLACSATAPRIETERALSWSGVTNPVTAVLLNFRAYDTLLEVAVLWLAVLAIIPLSAGTSPTTPHPAGAMLLAFLRLLVPLTVLVAAYLLWAGAHSPGGAFQAAAMLAAAAVLGILCGGRIANSADRRWRVVLVAGIVVFLLVAGVGMAAGGRFLAWPHPWAGQAIVTIETALTASIALTLVLLFGGTSPEQGAHDGDGNERDRTATGPRDMPAPGSCGKGPLV